MVVALTHQNTGFGLAENSLPTEGRDFRFFEAVEPSGSFGRMSIQRRCLTPDLATERRVVIDDCDFDAALSRPNRGCDSGGASTDNNNIECGQHYLVLGAYFHVGLT
jgi:hypothetical protein